MITLYTAATPNGWKASIALEELGLDYRVHKLDLGALEQKQDWYLKLNPNGRIPTIVDHDNGDLAVFESGAILLYLADKTGQLIPSDPRGRSVVTQWLMFQMSGVGPMQGQAGVFLRYAPERIEFAIGRYQRETRRLYEVLDRRLGEARYLGGEDYSIADIATWPWIVSYEWSGIDINGLDNLQRWMAEVSERPAVKRGRDVPVPVQRTEEQDAARIEAARKILS